MFSAAQKVFCIGKQLARKGDESTKHLRSRRFSTGGSTTNESQFSATGEAMASPQKFRLWRKTDRPARVEGGRPTKDNPAIYRFSVNFSAEEHARFLTMYEQSGLLSKAAFIKARIFGDVFRVIKTDRGTLGYVAKLTAFHAQFRGGCTNGLSDRGIRSYLLFCASKRNRPTPRYKG